MPILLHPCSFNRLLIRLGISTQRCLAHSFHRSRTCIFHNCARFLRLRFRLFNSFHDYRRGPSILSVEFRSLKSAVLSKRCHATMGRPLKLRRWRSFWSMNLCKAPGKRPPCGYAARATHCSRSNGWKHGKKLTKPPCKNTNKTKVSVQPRARLHARGKINLGGVSMWGLPHCSFCGANLQGLTAALEATMDLRSATI